MEVGKDLNRAEVLYEHNGPLIFKVSVTDTTTEIAMITEDDAYMVVELTNEDMKKVEDNKLTLHDAFKKPYALVTINEDSWIIKSIDRRDYTPTDKMLSDPGIYLVFRG